MTINFKYSAITTGTQLFNIFEEVYSKLSVDWTSFFVGQLCNEAKNIRGETNIKFLSIQHGW